MCLQVPHPAAPCIARMAAAGAPNSMAIHIYVGQPRAAVSALDRAAELCQRGVDPAAIAAAGYDLGHLLDLGRVLGELSQFHKYTASDLANLIDFDLDEESKAL